MSAGEGGLTDEMQGISGGDMWEQLKARRAESGPVSRKQDPGRLKKAQNCGASRNREGENHE